MQIVLSDHLAYRDRDLACSLVRIARVRGQHVVEHQDVTRFDVTRLAPGKTKLNAVLAALAPLLFPLKIPPAPFRIIFFGNPSVPDTLQNVFPARRNFWKAETPGRVHRVVDGNRGQGTVRA